MYRAWPTVIIDNMCS